MHSVLKTRVTFNVLFISQELVELMQFRLWYDLTLFWLCIFPQTQVVLRAESALVAKAVNHTWDRDRLILQDTFTAMQSRVSFCSRSHQSLYPNILGVLGAWQWSPARCHVDSAPLISKFTVFFFWTLLSFLPSLFFEAHFSSCFYFLSYYISFYIFPRTFSPGFLFCSLCHITAHATTYAWLCKKKLLKKRLSS